MIGVDIGGTKIAVGSVSGSRIVAGRKAPTPVGGDAIIARTVEMISEVAAGQWFSAVGVGAAGVLDRGVVVAAGGTMPGWAGTQLAGRLESALGVPIAAENDVKVAALGEIAAGAGRGLDRLLYVSFGTGVGGAIVLDGTVQVGSRGAAGELGHLLVDVKGALACGCGRDDHLESVAAGPAIAAAYRRRTGAVRQLPEIAAAARSGDPVAGEVIRHAAEAAGRAVAGLAVALDVPAVVIGGGVARLGPLLLDPLRAALTEAVPAWLGPVEVKASAAGVDGPILGAARLARGLLPGRSPAGLER